VSAEEGGAHAHLAQAEAFGAEVGGRWRGAVVAYGEGGVVVVGEQVDPGAAGVAVARGVADGFADDADEEGGLFGGGGGKVGIDGEFALDAEAGFKLPGEGGERLGEGEVGGAGAGEEVGDFAGAAAGLGEGVFEGAEALGGGRGALGDLFAQEGGEAGAAEQPNCEHLGDVRL